MTSRWRRLSSSRSVVVRPGRVPASRSACRTQRRNDSVRIPSFSPTDRIAAHCDGCSAAWSKTIRTARSRTSGEYLLGRPMGSIPSRKEPSDKLGTIQFWERTQRTRAEVRKAVAPKRNLARGRDAKGHSPNLLTGFSRCSICGCTMSSVSGGKGSPRLGCHRSWGEGRDACSNRLTIRMKVAEPRILATLQSELLKPAALRYITAGLDREVRRATAERSNGEGTLQRQHADESRKLQNLIAAIEGGSSAPGSLLKAVSDRETAIKRLEGELRKATQKPTKITEPDLGKWVEAQLQNLTELLKSDPAKVKAEFRRLNLQLTFKPTEATPRPHDVVSGQCDSPHWPFSICAPRVRFWTGCWSDPLWKSSRHSISVPTHLRDPRTRAWGESESGRAAAPPRPLAADRRCGPSPAPSSRPGRAFRDGR